jgi:two-component sensor histidine kinase
MLLGPPIELSADLAVPVGMALHELTTNAIRYGALSVPEGYVEVRWSLADAGGVRKLHLEWAERGGPPVTEPQHQGFGSTLLQRVLPLQCNAEVEVRYDRAGLRFRMDVPLIEQRLVPSY